MALRLLYLIFCQGGVLLMVESGGRKLLTADRMWER